MLKQQRFEVSWFKISQLSYAYKQQLLSGTICDILPPLVRGFITRLSLFFNVICKNIINPSIRVLAQQRQRLKMPHTYYYEVVMHY